MESLSALALRARDGDARARVELFDRLRRYVRALAAAPDAQPRNGQSPLDPSDLTHNVLIRVIRSLADFRGTSDPEFFAWIRSILRNHVIDGVRGANSERPLDLWDDTQDGHPIDDSTPSAKLLRAERIQQVAEALERLPDDQRDAVRWRHFDRLTLDEIGRRLGNRSADAAGQLVHRGMARLHEILSRID